MEQTGAGVEWLTPVPEVPSSILSRDAFHCGLEQITFSQLLMYQELSVINNTGYPHDGRADNAAYRHDRRVDKRR